MFNILSYTTINECKSRKGLETDWNSVTRYQNLFRQIETPRLEFFNKKKRRIIVIRQIKNYQESSK